MASLMVPDRRDPELVAVELNARRKPGEPLSVAADRLEGVEIPAYGTQAAVEWRAKLNGTVERANEAFKPR